MRGPGRRLAGWLPVAVLAAAALGTGWGIGRLYEPAAAALALPGWPWWGPRVRVGDRQFRPDVRVRPDVALTLEVWDVDQPAFRADASGGWEAVLAQALEAFRARYPNVTAEVRVLPWSRYVEAVSEGLRLGTLPDVLGTPDGIYIIDPTWQVPLRRYLEPRLPRDPAAAVLPGVWRLTESGGEWWGVPRWVEWYGWLGRAGGGPRVWMASGSALTWRFLAMTLTPPSAGPLWQRERLEKAAAWMASAPVSGGPVRAGVPLQRDDMSLLEPLYTGEADAAGPVSGRLLKRLGWWPYPEAPSAEAAMRPLAPAGGLGGGLPGPLLSASGYLVMARPGADDTRVQLAFELALHLARQASGAVSGREGVIPVWNPGWHEPQRRGRQREGPSEGPPWWSGARFPPGAEPLLQPRHEPGSRPAGAGAGGEPGSLAPPGPALWGARPWPEVVHEEQVVRQAAARLGDGRASVAEFIAQASQGSGAPPGRAEPRRAGAPGR